MSCSQRGTAPSKCVHFHCPPFGEMFQVGHGNQKFWSSVESHEFLVRVGSEAFRRLYKAPTPLFSVAGSLMKAKYSDWRWSTEQARHRWQNLRQR
jgi:hypothetical protein